MYILLNRKKVTETKSVEIPEPETVYVDRPVVKEIVKTIEKPIHHTVVQRVPQQVIQRVVEPIAYRATRPVIIEREKPRKKLNIPKYDYFGSTETKTYHKSSCRFRKLIKKKFQVSKNDVNYFKQHRFKPCKTCHPERTRKK